ncbi:MAG: hypothetical protein ACRC8Y_22035 [Chroococcales cyanobacterium]
MNWFHVRSNDFSRCRVTWLMPSNALLEAIAPVPKQVIGKMERIGFLFVVTTSVVAALLG